MHRLYGDDVILMNYFNTLTETKTCFIRNVLYVQVHLSTSCPSKKYDDVIILCLLIVCTSALINVMSIEKI